MTTSKPIHELLYMTSESYQQEYIERYLRWCLSYATNRETDLQKLLANRAISNYYNEKFKELELKFINAATPIYGNVTSESIRAIYVGITTQIFMNYPSALFEQARSLTILN